MLENIISSIISGIVVAVILEWWKSSRDARKAQKTESERGKKLELSSNPNSEASSSIRHYFRIGRIFWASFAGFFLSAIVAGIMEAEGHEEIEFGSFMMILLMALCTVIVWVLLTIRSAKNP